MTHLHLTASALTDRVRRIERLMTWLDGFMAGRENSDHHPASTTALRWLIDNILEAEVSGGVVRLPMDADQADSVDACMADVLCWFRGYRAGAPDRDEQLAADVDALRRFRLDLEKVKT